MASNIEIEFKSMLTETEFQQLLAHFDLVHTQPIIQTNTYYDTATQTLKNNRVALRLRNFDTRSEWTIKQANTTHESVEMNQPNPKAYTQPPQTISEQDIHDAHLLNILKLLNISLSQLQPICTLQTSRWVKLTDFGEFCLDQTTYYNETDYEIELETHDLEQAQSAFQTLLDTHNIPYRHADKKIARAMKKKPI